jgi:hypothetical protein
MHDHPDLIATAISPDGSKQWRLLRRADGLHTYDEETLEEAVYMVEEDGSERDIVAPARWTRTVISGLFETSEAARTDALGALPWLCGVIAECEDRRQLTRDSAASCRTANHP